MQAGRHVVSGDLFASGAQTLVNAVNCHGVMGAGIARAFRDRWPFMYADYQRLCASGGLRLGEPVLWRPMHRESGPQVVLFPTKDHWRDSSDITAVRDGLAYLVDHLAAWRVESLALPALGCGLGGLAWSEVQPVMTAALGQVTVPVEIYRPR